jgi:hypothetical protein
MGALEKRKRGPREGHRAFENTSSPDLIPSCRSAQAQLYRRIHADRHRQFLRDAIDQLIEAATDIEDLLEKLEYPAEDPAERLSTTAVIKWITAIRDEINLAEGLLVELDEVSEGAA